MKTRHYYLELITELDDSNPYFAQTYWVRSLEEAVKQYKKIKQFIAEMFDYEQFTDNFKCEIMFADYDEEEKNAEFDIDTYGSIYTNEKGKVIYETRR